MTKLETIAAKQADVNAARATLETAEFALRDAQLLPDDATPPVPKLWEVSITPNLNAALVTADGSPVSLDSGGNLGSALFQTGLFPGVIEGAVEGDNNRARASSVDKPATLSVIYTAGQDADGNWQYAPAVPVEWTEVAAG